jgi:hypothetical protein
MNVRTQPAGGVIAGVSAFCVAAIMPGCAGYQQQLAVSQASSAIVVTPGDINRQYDILGTIQWPGVGYRTLFSTPCTPEKLREEAFARWGYSVSAVIGYTSWNDGGQIQCSGTAIRFSGTSSIPRDTTASSGAPNSDAWSSSAWCQSIRAGGGSACDEHQFSVYPGVRDVVDHVITSMPDGVRTYLYMPSLKRIRHIGTTPFKATIARETAASFAYCAGSCSDTASFITAQPRNLEFRFEQTEKGWQGQIVDNR